MKKTLALLPLIFLWVFYITACSDATGNGESIATGHGWSVAPRFERFYDWLGGVEVVGVPISPVFNHGQKEFQYTAAVLMVYDPEADESQRYQLAPLGDEFGVAEAPEDPDSPFGHPIYPGFAELYNRLGGARMVGLPLTKYRYNPENRRYEQYFESIGIYRLEDEPEGEAHLLHYGAYKCAEVCGYVSPREAMVSTTSSATATQFSQAVARLDPIFTGAPLTNPYPSFDGLMEQIFEHLVVVEDTSRPGEIGLRPMMTMLGMMAEENRDYPIPDHLKEYLDDHQGLEFSGPPISEYSKESDSVYRQCFTSFCLDYYPDAPDGLQIRPAPFGYDYKQKIYTEVVQIREQGMQKINIHLLPQYPNLSRQQQQVIQVQVDTGSSALPGVQPVLTLSISGGEISSYSLPPTDESGTTWIELEPLDYPNGTRVDMEVCVPDGEQGVLCETGYFILWDPPS